MFRNNFFQIFLNDTKSFLMNPWLYIHIFHQFQFYISNILHFPPKVCASHQQGDKLDDTNAVTSWFNFCNSLKHKVCVLDLVQLEDNLQGVPKKMLLLSSFEFLTLGGVFLGVKNNSKNFGNKKNIGLCTGFATKTL